MLLECELFIFRVLLFAYSMKSSKRKCLQGYAEREYITNHHHPTFSRIIAHDCTDVNGSRLTAVICPTSRCPTI